MNEHEAAPFRVVGDFTPLITAEQGFPAFERLALGATKQLWLSFRIFDPTTRLRHATTCGATWLDLLRHRLKDGVQIRILLTDFDPIMVPDLHEASVRAEAALKDLERDGDIETMIVRHEARVGKGVRLGLWLPVARALDRQRSALNQMPDDARSDAFAHRPGIWRYLRKRDDGRIVWRIPKLPRLYPATFHQKIAVADSDAAIIGGLDIDERRYDSQDHDRAAQETWQDVSMRVTGDVVGDISRHIADCWNQNRLRMKALRREQARHAPSGGVRLSPGISTLSAGAIPDVDAGRDGIRLLRTASVQKRRVGLRFSPRTVVNEIEAAHIAAIRSAKHAIYIETQFFRSHAIADALTDAADRTPDLGLVMVLPAAPETIAFEQQMRLPERMGEHLQSACLEMVQDAFADRAVVLSPVMPVASTSDTRDHLHDAPIIYVHSKVLIVDETLCIVGSANLNGRSMKWDTEAAVECRDAKAVRALRMAVLQHWLPENPDAGLFDTSNMAAAWGALAKGNADQPPEQRKGFLVPHNAAPARQVGLPVPGVPDELV